MATAAIELFERGWVPDAVARLGIRRLLSDRLRTEGDRYESYITQWVSEMERGPVAEVPDLANEQHYEVPAEFYEIVLGKHLKYSSGYWPKGVSTLDDAEAAMLALTCARAQIQDGHDILELGCGWGSLTVWMAERFPNSRITAVSNSASQKDHIDNRLRKRGLGNVTVITRDMNDFETDQTFDRIVSVEMFEHMRNWSLLFSRAATWMKPEAKMFIHVFAHHTFAYPYETSGDDDWMGQHFFTGGMMPSFDLVDRVKSPLHVANRWSVNGEHYSKTAEAWLSNLKSSRSQVLDTLSGHEQPHRQFHRWKAFFLACAESFGYQNGNEWMVAHYLLAKGDVQ